MAKAKSSSICLRMEAPEVEARAMISVSSAYWRVTGGRWGQEGGRTIVQPGLFPPFVGLDLPHLQLIHGLGHHTMENSSLACIQDSPCPLAEGARKTLVMEDMLRMESQEMESKAFLKPS